MAGNNTLAPPQVGNVKEIIVPNPVANTFTFTVPTSPEGEMYLLRSVKFDYTADGTAGNRSLYIYTENETSDALAQMPTNGVDFLTASQVKTFYYMVGYPLFHNVIPGFNNQFLSLPGGTWLNPGWSIVGDAVNKQAGDVFANIRLVVQSFLVPV